MRRYRHIFFDLDHTLWDFTTNSRATLRELYTDLGLAAAGISTPDELIEVYEEVNRDLWGRYEQGHIPKEVMRVLRFRNALARFGVSRRGLAETMSREYLERCPRHSILFPGVFELLHDLKPHYRLHIITNGFDEVQRLKLRCSKIDGLFDVLVTSERAGASKPSPVIFAFAQRRSGALPRESLMVGDNVLSDMLGARRAGWDQAHFAVEVEPDPEATYRLGHMDDLRPLLL